MLFFRGILSICSVEPRTLATKVLIFNVKSVVFHRIQSCSECSCRKNFISFFYTLKACYNNKEQKVLLGFILFWLQRKKPKEVQLTIDATSSQRKGVSSKVVDIKQWKNIVLQKKECLKDAGASFAWFSAVRQTFTIHTSNTEEFYRQWQCSNQLLLHANIKLLL